MSFAEWSQRRPVGRCARGLSSSSEERRRRRALRVPQIDRLEERQLLTVSPLGGEILINQNPSFEQRLGAPTLTIPASFEISPSNRSVAVDSSGDFIVAWTSYGNQDGDQAGVYARLYNEFGLPLTNEFQINQYTLGDQKNVSVAMDIDGDFIVTWESAGQDPYDGSSGIFARRYSAAGLPLSDEFHVNTDTNGPQINPAVGMDYAGNFVITWESQAQDGGFFNEVKAQRYSFEGVPLGREFRVNDSNLPGLFQESNPSVGLAPNGNFVVTWDMRIRRVGTTVFGSEVFFRLFSADGQPLTSAAQANLTSGDAWTNIVDTNEVGTGHIDAPDLRFEQRNGTVAMDAEGNFTIAWESFQDNDIQGGGFDGPESYGIYFRRFHADGRPSAFTQEVVLNPVFTFDATDPLTVSIFAGDQLNPSIGLSADGELVGVWSGPGSSDLLGAGLDDNGVWHRLYTPSSALDITDPLTGEVIIEPGNIPAIGGLNFPSAKVSSTTFGNQDRATVAMNRSGDFVVNWQGNGVGDLQGIFAQMYRDNIDRAGPLVSDVSINSRRLANNGQVVDVVNQIVVQFDEQLSTAGGRNGTSSVLNPNNWQLLRDGLPMLGAITNITFQKNPGTNKWEATLSLNGDAPRTGSAPLRDGNYELVALQNIRDVFGNPLASYGRQLSGLAFHISFNIIQATSTETLVNTTIAGPQVTQAESPQNVAATPAGDSVVVWSGIGAGNAQGVFFQLYDAAGNRNGGETRVNLDTSGTHTNPAVAIDADGDFVVTWAAYTPGTDEWDILAQRFDSAGRRVGSTFTANATRQDFQRYPTVAMDAAGDFLIAWQSYGQDGSAYGIFAQRYDNVGSPLGGVNEVQQLNITGTPTGGTFTLGMNGVTFGPIAYATTNQGADTARNIEAALRGADDLNPILDVTVRANSLNEFVITYAGLDGSANLPQLSVAVNALSGSGVQIRTATVTDGRAGEFQVNETEFNNQRFPQAAMNSEGQFVVTWTSSGQDGDDLFESNIYARLFASNDALSGAGSQNSAVRNALSGESQYTSLGEVFSVDGQAYDGGSLFSDDFVLGPTTPGKWGPTQYGTGAVITYAFMDTAVRDSDNLEDGWTNTPLNAFMPAGAKDQIRAAFAAWAEFANLTFIEVIDSGEKFGAAGTADIRIGGHDEGTGGVLAHAFFPPVNSDFVGVPGDLHFNTQVDWEIGFGGDPNAFDIFQVTAHEIGHALGLGHTDVPNSLMNPIYSEGFRGPQPDDIAGMQFLYGVARSGALTREFRVNQTVSGNQQYQSVAMDSDGDFIVTWTSYGQDGRGDGYGSGYNGENGVYARRFDRTGQPIQAQQFTLQYVSSNVPVPITDSTGTTIFTVSRLDVPDDFLVTNAKLTVDITHPRVSDLRLLLFSPDEEPIAGGLGDVLVDQVAVVGANFHGTTFDDTAGTAIADGLPPFSGPFRPEGSLAAYVAGKQSKGSWYLGINDLVPQQVGVLNGWSLTLSGLSANGDEFQVNRFTDGNQQYSRVAMDAQGNFTIVWESFQDDVAPLGTPDSYGIYAQKYASSDNLNQRPLGVGGAIGDEFRVPFTVAGDQRFPGVALDYSGNATMVWSGNGVDAARGADPAGVWTRRVTSGTRSGAPIVTSVFLNENETQSLVITGSPTGGSFQLRVGSATTDTIVYAPANDGADAAAAIRAALGAVGFDVDVTPVSSTEFRIVFRNADGAANQPQIQVLNASFSGDPTATATINTTLEGQQTTVRDGASFDHTIARMVVRFSEPMTTAGGPVGANSVLNPDNWALSRNGVFVLGAIADIDFALNAAAAAGLGEPSGKYEAVVTFDASASTSGLQPLGDGSYVLFALDNITDLDGNRLDGDYDGRAGGAFDRSFTIRIAPPRGADEFPVNSTLPGVQRTDAESPRSIAADAEGNYVVVWTAVGQAGPGDAVFMRRYNATGVPQGPEVRVSQDDVHANHAVVALDGDGDFVITWTGYGLEGDSATQGNIYARRYAANGASRGSAFRVNNTVSGAQKWSSVAVDVLGDFVVTWTSYGQDEGGYGVFARRYNTAGVAQGREFLVNQITDGNQQFSDVAMDADGNFIISWAAFGQSAGTDGVYARKYNADGSDWANPNVPAQGLGAFRVDTISADVDRYPRIAADLVGEFVVTWTSLPVDGSGTGIYARRFDRFALPATDDEGAALPEFRVNVTTTGDQAFSAVALDHDGDFTIAWSGYGSQSGQADQAGVFARRFFKDGTPNAPPAGAGGQDEFRVNTTIAMVQRVPSVALSGTGDLVVIWTGNGVGDDQGIFGRQFDLPGDEDDDGPIVTDVVINGNQVLDGTQLTESVAQIRVLLGEEMSPTNGPDAFDSVLNPENWILVRNGSPLLGGIIAVTFDRDPLTRKWTAILTVDGNGLESGTPPLPDGEYVLTARDFMIDLAGNPLDGNYDGVPGIDFARTFSIGQPLNAGTEFRGNTSTDGEQQTAAETSQSVALDDDGDYVMVWAGAGNQPGQEDSDGVFFQIFNANGTKRGGEVRVNTTVAGKQAFPAVAADADGDFIVTWTGYGQDSDEGTNTNVYARTFDAAGNATSGEFLVNGTVAGVQKWSSVATSARGDFVITWTGLGQNGDNTANGNIFYRLYTKEGVPQSSEVQVNDRVARYSNQNPLPIPVSIGSAATVRSTIEIDDSYSITDVNVLLNIDHGPDSDLVVFLEGPDGTRVQLFANVGGAGANFTNTVLDQQAGTPIAAGVAPFSGIFRPSGDLSVFNGRNINGTWTLEVTDFNGSVVDDTANGTLRNWSLSVSRSGIASGNTTGQLLSTNQQLSRVAMDADGDFVVVWEDNGRDGDGYGIFAQAFDNLGAAVEGNFQVNTTSALDQRQPTVATDRRGGNFVIAWSSQGQDGDGYGIYARRFAAGAVILPGGEIAVNTTVEGDQQHPSVGMGSLGDFVITWDGIGAQGAQADDDGVFAQRFSANGTRRGGEFRVNTTVDGLQQFPSVAMDGSGDFVVVWSGMGLQTGETDLDGGVFGQRYDTGVDRAGPIVADVLIDGARLLTDEPLVQSIDTLLVTFGEQLTVEGGTSGVRSVTNPLNWSVTRAGVGGSGGVAAVNFSFNAITQRWEAILRLDSDPSRPGFQPFGPGEYVLTARSSIRDLFGNDLDGTYASSLLGGSNFQLFFTIADLGGDGGGGVGPAGDEFFVNSERTGNNVYADVALDASGNFVVVWERDGNVFGQAYNAAGTARGTQFEITDDDTTVPVRQQTPRVAADAAGNFVVVWAGGTNTRDDDTAGIYARRYNRFGVAQGSLFRVNQFTPGTQNQPDVAMLPNGEFVVTWSSLTNPSDTDSVWARRFSSTGAALSDEFRVNTTTANRQENSAIAVDADGDFVVTWDSYNQDSSFWGVYGQRFARTGARNGNEFRVNNFTTGIQRDSKVAMDADGDFVVIYQSYGQNAAGYDIFARRFDRFGNPQGNEVMVNQYTLNRQWTADVTMNDVGDFVVTWASLGADGDGDGIFARGYRFDGRDVINPDTGQLIGEFRVNTTTRGQQFAPAIDADPDGNFVVVWTSVADGLVTPPNPNVLGQRYRFNPSVLGLTARSTSDILDVTLNADGSLGQVKLNGSAVAVDPAVTTLNFQGTGGSSSIVVHGSPLAESARLAAGYGTIDNGRVRIVYHDVLYATVHSGGGADAVTLLDNAGANQLTSSAGTTRIAGSSFGLEARGYAQVNVLGGAGTDQASLQAGTTGSTATFHPRETILTGGGQTVDVRDFGQVTVLAGSAADVAYLHGSGGTDVLNVSPTEASISSAGFANTARGFRQVQSFGGVGNDQANLHGGAGDDVVTLRPGSAQFSGDGFFALAQGYSQMRAYGGTGNDQAYLYDSAGDDTLVMRPTSSQLAGNGYFQWVQDFDQVRAFGTVGNNAAYFYTSAGADQFSANPGSVQLTGSGFLTAARGFNSVRAFAASGSQATAALYDSAGSDAFVGGQNYAQLTGPGYSTYVKDFRQVRAYSTGAAGSATFYAAADNSSLVSTGAYSQVTGGGFANYAQGFGAVRAFASGANSSAFFYSSADNARLVASPTQAQLSSSGFAGLAQNFKNVSVTAAGGGSSAILYGSAGSDALISQPGYTQLAGSSFSNQVRNFGSVDIRGGSGQSTATLYGAPTGTNQAVLSSSGVSLNAAGYVSNISGFKTVNVNGVGATNRLALVDAALSDDLTVDEELIEFSAGLWSATFNSFQLNGGTSGNDSSSGSNNLFPFDDDNG